MLTKQYVRGFNHGYILTKYEPKLADKVIKKENNHSDYLKGLFSGKQEYKMEKTLGKSKGEQKQNITQTKNIKKGRT